MVHLKKQHSNIYDTPQWETSRYNVIWEKIKKDHKIRWDKKDV